MVRDKMNTSMPTFFDTPWKLTNLFASIVAHPFAWLILCLNGISFPPGSRFIGIPIIQKHRRSSMHLGKGMQLRSTPTGNPLGANRPVILCTWQAGAELKIGEFFGMTGGTICAAQSITIGDHVIIGANSSVIDTDFHPLDYATRSITPQAGISRPIVIEDEVFIGMNSIVLKGVRIGRGSVIGAGSVVTRDIPPGVIAAGNPARVLQEIHPSQDALALKV
jgi:acetyltransferase-like isoleucine patch superfamily enzyme